MKRSIILLLVLLPIVAFSQMQNIINQGNTATTQRIINFQNVIDSNLMRVRSVNSNELITSIPQINQTTLFIRSTIGTDSITVSTLSNLKVHDFKILNGQIYFCGESNFYGCFIGWTTINNLFSQNPSPITLQIINNPIKPTAITELEVYLCNNDVYLTALADSIYLIEMNTSNPNTYQIMQNNVGKFRNLSVGNKKIVTLETVNDTSIIITAFDKTNIPNYMYRAFTHPILRYDKYVLENLMTNTDIFTFAYTHRTNDNNTYYKTDFVTFEITNGILLMNKQCLEVADGKLEPIDLEFCIEDSTLLYLAGGCYGYDEIYPIKPLEYGDYNITTIKPPTPTNYMKKQYNSIVRYDNYYFAAIAKGINLNQVSIFDCLRSVIPSFNCAKNYNEIVRNYYYLNNASLSANYTYMIGQQLTSTINVSSNTMVCINNCQ
jgi:hypothetical protein